MNNILKINIKIEKVEKEIMNSEEYGQEYALFVLMKKVSTEPLIK